MSFESYKNIAEVLRDYEITSTEANFIEETVFPIREAFQDDLEFSLREFSFAESEYGVCEVIIFPVLKEVYRHYLNKFTLWSHKSLAYDEKLSGTPDYLLAKRSPLGKEVFEQPFFTTVEAKRDDFIKGWGLCLAEMVALQKINELRGKPVYGIVSNGQLWQFGKLTDNQFVRHFKAYTVYNLGELLGAVNDVFRQCEQAWEV